MHLICPHCQNPIELADAPSQDEILCSACGSSFRLERGSTVTADPQNGPRKLGKFELIGVVGMGAFGTVYKARDPELARLVAIKVPRSGNLASSDDLDRFLREARSVAQLRHPSIVPVYEVGQVDNVPYLVSEFVQGMTLTDLLTARKRTPREAAELIAAVADTLQYAHEQGVVHRDVKPSNILLDDDGKPHLMDFGLAKRDAGEVTMTVEGQVLGTPAYMSPEQARGEAHQVDGRSDIYSLGVILYQMLTGSLPFQGNARVLLHQVQHDDPRPPRSLDGLIPRDLETICLKCLLKEPARRYATGKEFADDLRRFLAGEPIRARPLGAWEKASRWFKRRREVALVLAGAAAAVGLLFALAMLSGFFHKQPADVPTEPGLGEQRAGPETLATSPGTSPEEDKPLPADLALVPRDAFAFVSIRVADLLSTPGIQRVQEKIAKEILEQPHRLPTWQELWAFDIGIKPEQISRVTFVLNWDGVEGARQNITIFTTVQPYRKADVLKPLGPDVKEIKEGNISYYLGKYGAFLVNDRLFVMGDIRSLPQYLSNLPVSADSGPLEDALHLIKPMHHLAVGINPPPWLPAMRKQVLQGQFEQFRPVLMHVQSAALFTRLDSGLPPRPSTDSIDVDLRLFFFDSKNARRGEIDTLAALKELEKLLRKIIEEKANDLNLEKKNSTPIGRAYDDFSIKWGLQFANRIDEGLKRVEVKRQEKAVKVRFSLIADLPALGVDFAQAWIKMERDAPLLSLKKNLLELAIAMHCVRDKQGCFPPSAIYSKDGKPLLSWRVAVLPEIEKQDGLYRQFKLDEPWDSPHNLKLLEKMPAVYAPPENAARKPHTTFYQVFVGKGTMFEGNQGVKDIPDGLSNTLLIVEGAEAVPWTKPEDLPYDPTRPLPKLGGAFVDGFWAVFADGNSRFIKKTVSSDVLRALITRNGREKVDLDKLP